MHRIDRTGAATMYRGGMLSASELEQLHRIPAAVRLGRIEPDRTVLDDGELATGPEVLHVDCTAHGLRDSAPVPVPIFAPGSIVLQQVRHNSPAFNAALVAFVEARRDDDEEKNRMCPPNAYARDPGGYARLLARTWRTEGASLREPDVSHWVGARRLNLLGAPAEHQPSPQAVEAITRYLTHVGDAVHRLRGFDEAERAW